MRYLVTFRPETALRPTTVVADGFRVLTASGMALFGPGGGAGPPAEMWSLRFLASVQVEGDTTDIVYLAEPGGVTGPGVPAWRPGGP